MRVKVEDTSSVYGRAGYVHIWLEGSLKRYEAPKEGGPVVLYDTRIVVHDIPESNDGFRSAHSWTEEEKTEEIVGEYFPEDGCVELTHEYSARLEKLRKEKEEAERRERELEEWREQDKLRKMARYKRFEGIEVVLPSGERAVTGINAGGVTYPGMFSDNEIGIEKPEEQDYDYVVSEIRRLASEGKEGYIFLPKGKIYLL